MEEREFILEQWKTCVEMANSISHRRDVMNNLFVTLNTAMLTAILLNSENIFWLLGIIGIVFCIIWFFLLSNYKKLNSVKFDIICKLEKELPYQPFSEEWEKLKQQKCYFKQTLLEKILPIIFVIGYLIVIILNNAL